MGEVNVYEYGRTYHNAQWKAFTELITSYQTFPHSFQARAPDFLAFDRAWLVEQRFELDTRWRG